ncbi:MAG: PIN domain-containing protein [Saprospiraceae bacterium]|nr:PIN domain-containing protein [Saprospiraceae bacterium]
MDKILIDTDVILDFFFDRIPYSTHAAGILSLCEKKELNAFVTPVLISNVYYILNKTAKHEKVIQHLKLLLNIVDVAIINKESVSNSLNSEFKDFEDALQNFSAQSDKGIKVIITRNIKDYKTSKLSVMTPETYLKTFWT